MTYKKRNEASFSRSHPMSSSYTSNASSSSRTKVVNTGRRSWTRWLSLTESSSSKSCSPSQKPVIYQMSSWRRSTRFRASFTIKQPLLSMKVATTSPIASTSMTLIGASMMTGMSSRSVEASSCRQLSQMRLSTRMPTFLCFANVYLQRYHGEHHHQNQQPLANRPKNSVSDYNINAQKCTI